MTEVGRASRAASGSGTSLWPDRASGAAIISLVVVLFLVHGLRHTAAAAEYEPRTATAIVVDADTGKVLYASKADKQAYPASLTKIMTLYMVFDALDRGRIRLTTRIPVSRNASKQKPSKLYLRAGDRISVRDAIFALITKSANDVATAVAEYLGGTEQKFARMMTRKARAFGMSRTVFRNASGLPDPGQKSTARDMSRLARIMLRDFPGYYDYFATKTWKYRGKRYKNHNKMLQSYRGTDGIKTGYTRASGFNLVASVKRGGRRLIGVVFGGKSGDSRNTRMMGILNKSFRRLPPLEVAKVMPPRAKPQFLADRGRSGGLRVARLDPSLDRGPAGRASPSALPRPPLPNPRRLAAPARPAVRQILATQPTFIMARPAARPASALAPTRVAATAAVPRLPASARTVSLSTTPAPRAIPAPQPGRPRDRSSRQAWSIQVGAFSRYAPAHRAITSATRQIPGLLMSTKVAIIPVEKNQATLYRARMIGLSEAGARTACSKLRNQNMPCMPVPPNDEAIYILSQALEQG